MLPLLRVLPKNQLSYLVGRLSSLRLPPFVQKKILRWFVDRYNVNLDEAQKTLEEYPSLSEFFVRNLKDGIRPIGEGVVSPVDGAITSFGSLEGEKLLQVKGKTYSVYTLLQDETLAKRFVDGFFITFYLAPPDYHHIHSPVDGQIRELHYIPGALWPVNEQSVEKINQLFAVNERIITAIESELGMVGVVMVGATNVGSIRLSFDDLRSNQYLLKKGKKLHRTYVTPKLIKKGERLGTFHFGSTVILLFEKGKFTATKNIKSGRVRFGQSLTEVR